MRPVYILEGVYFTLLIKNLYLFSSHPLRDTQSTYDQIPELGNS